MSLSWARVHPAARLSLSLLLSVGLGLAGGWLGLVVAGSVHHEVGPLTTSMQVVPTWGGGTVVEVAPLGELRLDTHPGPLGVHATLDGFDVEEARALVTNPEQLSTLKPDAVADITWAVKMAGGTSEASGETASRSESWNSSGCPSTMKSTKSRCTWKTPLARTPPARIAGARPKVAYAADMV